MPVPTGLLKRVVVQSFARAGIEFHRRGQVPNLIDFLAARHVDLVLDVGANTGQFGRWLRQRGYRGEIISFEPIRAVFRELKSLAERDGNWRVHNLALGATSNSRALINVSGDTRFSSILDQLPAARQFDANATVVSQEETVIARLDDLSIPFHKRVVFLKCDTQGYERSVLDGAGESLNEIAGVQLELPIVNLYRNTWSIAEAIAYMRDEGFVLSQIHPVNFCRDDPVSLLEIDGVFRRVDQC